MQQEHLPWAGSLRKAVQGARDSGPGAGQSGICGPVLLLPVSVIWGTPLVRLCLGSCPCTNWDTEMQHGNQGGNAGQGAWHLVGPDHDYSE